MILTARAVLAHLTFVCLACLLSGCVQLSLPQNQQHMGWTVRSLERSVSQYMGMMKTQTAQSKYTLELTRNQQEPQSYTGTLYNLETAYDVPVRCIASTLQKLSCLSVNVFSLEVLRLEGVWQLDDDQEHLVGVFEYFNNEVVVAQGNFTFTALSQN